MASNPILCEGPEILCPLPLLESVRSKNKRSKKIDAALNSAVDVTIVRNAVEDYIPDF
jgi:hypothetical protein